MPSFDVISKINYQEFDNALANCLREINNRYDFKGLHVSIDRKDKIVTTNAPDELKLKQINELIQNVKTKWIELKVANSSVSAKKSEVDALAGLYDSIFEEWKLGSKTSLDSDQAYQNMLNAEVDLLTASVNVIMAKYRLLKEIGTLKRKL